ncbi:MAG: hypothetical protein ACJ8EW_24110 [Rhizobium sp.]|uniref:hypothetical protein n=1 Tax=Rhizobium sp. TaxID=391 RepID=UPI00389A4046
MFEFASGFAEEGRSDVAFLRAERRDDGTRSFKLTEAAPLRTSFGGDLDIRTFSQRRPAGGADQSNG